jgi:hypothetical protein
MGTTIAPFDISARGDIRPLATNIRGGAGGYGKTNIDTADALKNLQDQLDSLRNAINNTSIDLSATNPSVPGAFQLERLDKQAFRDPKCTRFRGAW